MTDAQQETGLRHEVLIAFQSALLGMVTPALRGVTAEWNEKHISGLCVYDGEVSESDEDTVSDVEAEVISHFLDHTIDLKAVASDASISLDHFSLGTWVYRRSE